MDAVVETLLGTIKDKLDVPTSLPANTNYKDLVENILGRSYKVKGADWKDIYNRIILGRKSLYNSNNVKTIMFAMAIETKGDILANIVHMAFLNAATYDYSDIANYLLGHKTVTLKTKRQGYYLACYYGSLVVLRKLMSLDDSSVFVNCPEALAFASAGGKINALQMLHGDLRVQTSCPDGIRLACSAGHLEVVKYWQARGSILSRNNNELLKAATKRCRVEVIMYLLSDPLVDPTVDDNTLFCWSAISNNDEILHKLIKDPRVVVEPLSPYLSKWICSSNNDKTLKILLEDGRFDVSYDESKCLRRAVRNNFPDLVKILKQDKRVDVLCRDGYPTKVAEELEFEEVLAALGVEKESEKLAEKDLEDFLV